MKILRIILLFGILVALVPVKSYALIDIGAYGGYSFENKVKTSDGELKTQGFGFGFIGHYNMTVIPMVLSIGIGPYYEKFYLNYKWYSVKSDYDLQTVGLDVFAMLELPIVVHPFVRASVAVWEQTQKNNDYFRSFSFGPGVGFDILILQIYTEYLFNTSKQRGNDAYGHTINLGIRIRL